MKTPQQHNDDILKEFYALIDKRKSAWVGDSRYTLAGHLLRQLDAKDTYWRERVEQAYIDGFIDGFMRSGEGYNGEYLCGNDVSEERVRKELADQLQDLRE